MSIVFNGAFLVTFKGMRLWYLPDNEQWGDSGPLAPTEHCDDIGRVTTMTGMSYAHYFADTDEILQHGNPIGKLSDLVKVVPS